MWAFAKIGYDPSKIRDLLQAFAQEVSAIMPGSPACACAFMETQIPLKAFLFLT